MPKIKDLIETLGHMDQEAEARYLIICRDDDGVVLAMSSDIKESDLRLFKEVFDDNNI